MSFKTDTGCIIVGQGICGTLLSYELLRAGYDVIIIDDAQPFSAGRVASGLINPVTGMRVAKSWLTDELLPVAIDTYRALEEKLGVSIARRLNILEFHPDIKHRDTFNERIAQYPEHLSVYTNDTDWNTTFNFHYGIGSITSSMLIDMRALQDAWRTYMKQKGLLLNERFKQDVLAINSAGVQYKDIKANKIIFCDGINGIHHPYFHLLPFSFNKGEALIATIPGLSRNYVYKNNLKIAPWGDDQFWIGSSFEWTFADDKPSEKFRQNAGQLLHYWLRLPYTITDHWASVRPATVDHKPFVGFHPIHTHVGILNGMGAKGCSQAPYFARSLAHNIVSGSSVHKEADISRYSRILSR